MTLMKLRRHAPEAQPATECCVCGTNDMAQVQNHVLVGTPGVPLTDGGVCEQCGRVLGRVVEKFGSELTVQVEEAQKDANERDVALKKPRRAARS